jgi:hypothetical protein
VRQPEVHPIKRERITEKPERTRLEKVTTLLQAVSAVLVPVLIAAGSLFIQQSIARQTTAKDYVALAIDILKVDPKAQDLFTGNPLRNWAVDVLVKDSPVPIPQQAQDQLKTTRVIVYEPSKILPEGLERLQKGGSAPTPEPSETRKLAIELLLNILSSKNRKI